MKTKNVIIGLLMLVITFSACKKDKVAADDPNDPAVTVTQDDLLPYYIVASRKAGDSKLAVFYFSKEGNTVKINLHRHGYLRIGNVTIDKSNLNFDVDGTGNTVYNFVFEKDVAGKLSLKSYSFTDKSNASQGIEYAVLGNQPAAPVYENSKYKSGALAFEFSAAGKIDWDVRSRQIGTKYYPPPINQTLPVMAIAPEVSVPFYGISNAGFKAGEDFIGAFVPSWKDSGTPLLLVERNNTIYPAVKQ